jgi:hypothetical protein
MVRYGILLLLKFEFNYYYNFVTLVFACQKLNQLSYEYECTTHLTLILKIVLMDHSSYMILCIYYIYGRPLS